MASRVNLKGEDNVEDLADPVLEEGAAEREMLWRQLVRTT